MSVFDTFFILFKTDAKQAEKELNSADDAAKKLATDIDKVGKVDTSKVADLNKKLNETAAAAKVAGAELDKAAKTPAPKAPPVANLLIPPNKAPPVANLLTPGLAAPSVSPTTAAALTAAIAAPAVPAPIPAVAALAADIPPVVIPTVLAPPDVTGLTTALQNAGAVNPEGVQKLDVALKQAQMDAKELGVLAAKAKFDGKPNAEDLARQAEKAKIQADELGVALTRAKSELAGAATQAGNLQKELSGADQNSQKLGQSFVSNLQSLAAPLVALSLVVVGAKEALSIAFARMKAVADIGDQSGKLRSTAQDYDAFTRAVRASGGSIDDAKNNLIKFNDKLNDAVANVKGSSAKEFAKWGVQFKDVKGHALGAVDGILALSKSLEHVSQAEAIGRLRKLGINDAATIALILQGKNAIIEKMNAEKAAGVVTDEQIQIAGDYQNELGATQNMLDSFGNQIMQVVIPAVTRLMGVFREAFSWLINHKVLVEGFFIGVAAAVTAYFLPAMIEAAIAVLAATWPFLLIAAAIAAAGAAFALLYEDIVAFMNGEPSEIGVLAEKYEWFAEAVKGIGVAFRATAELSRQMWEAIGAAADAGSKAFAEAWTSTIKPAISEGTEFAIQSGANMRDNMIAAWNAVSAGAVAFFHTLDPYWENLKQAGQLVADIFNRIFPQLQADADRISDKFITRFNEVRTNVGAAITGMYDDAKPVFDKIIAAADAIKSAFIVAFDALSAAWNATIGRMAAGISDTIARARNLLGLNPVNGMVPAAGTPMPLTAGTAISGALKSVAPTPQFVPDPNSAGAQIGAMFGKKALQGATSNPLGAQTPGSIAGAGVTSVDNTKNTTNTVNVGAVNVQTQATDAAGVAAGVRDALKGELRTTISNFDDGVQK